MEKQRWAQSEKRREEKRREEKRREEKRREEKRREDQRREGTSLTCAHTQTSLAPTFGVREHIQPFRV